MIQAALTPKCDSQSFAKAWMEDFFNTYGDKSPNSQEVLLSLMQNNDVYVKYETYCIENNIQERVDYSKFNGLWKTIFPFVNIRLCR